MDISNDIYNLAYSCIIDGSYDGGQITTKEAQYTIDCWELEKGCSIKGLNAESFMIAWNTVVNEIRR